MNQEIKRTYIYLAVAAVVTVAAVGAEFASQPAQIEDFVNVGTPFYPDFTDPTKAKELDLYVYDADKAQVSTFEVVLEDGVYKIPSYNNYPADAEDHLAEVATSLLDLKRDALAGRRASDHERYGVIAPLSEESDTLKGRGNQITLKNEAGEILVDYIIGNPVEGNEGQYYVRKPTEKETYRVELKINLSTKLEDWVESDLLKLTQSDLRHVLFDRYSIDPDRGVKKVGQSSELNRTSANEDWTLADLNLIDEQVNQDDLRTFVSTLDNLKLIGVRPKPQGVNANLEIDQKIVQNQMTLDLLISDLTNKGYFPVPNEKGDMELLAKEGEIDLTTEQGLVYTLRFGNKFTGTSEEIEAGFLSEEKKPESKDNKPAEEEKEQGEEEEATDSEDGLIQGRYLFVSVAFDQNALGSAPVEPTAPEKPEGFPEEKTEDKDKKDQEAAKADDTPEAPKEENKEEPPEFAAYREALKKYETDLATYQSDLKTYEDKLEEGQKKADELNTRFSEWYYVISDESYEKINLTREQLVKPAEGTENVDGAPAKPAFGTPGGLGGDALNNLNNLIPQLDAPTQKPTTSTKPPAAKEKTAAPDPTEKPKEAEKAEPAKEAESPEKTVTEPDTEKPAAE